MLTIRDCVDLTDLSEEEIEAIAAHEHLPFIVGLEKGSELLGHEWGDAAIRQIALDNLAHARLEQSHGSEIGGREFYFRDVYLRTCAHHPGSCDRRHHLRV